MTLSIVRVMLLGLLRDRGTLAMLFVLPPMIYLIFAVTFSGASGGDLRLRVATLDSVNSPISQRLVAAIRAEPTLRQAARLPATIAELEDMVRLDEADAGIIIRSDPSEPAAVPGQSPIVVFGDAAKAMAGGLITGQIQRIFSEQLPDAAYRRVLADFERTIMPFSPQQRTRADGIIDFIARSREPDAKGSLRDAVASRATPPLVALQSSGLAKATMAATVYYAGAVAMLFLLYSAMHGALSLIEERQSGILTRILHSAGGIGSVLGGKFAFLTAQGIVQASLIFLVASIVYGVDVMSKLPLWFAITVAASAAAAALGLALSAFCHTRQQAQTLSTFLVLVLSALGGSMVPRFLMPPWLQEVSWGLPNAWGIEAYHSLLWRDAGLAALAPLLGGMLAFALVMFALAWALMHQTQQRTA